MTPEEINEQVALKLGRKHEIAGFVNDPIEGAPCQRVAIYQKTPDYCHSIEAAWEIVEKLPFVNLTKRVGPDQSDPLIQRTLYRCVIDEYKTEAISDTAPMAIALAFLKLP